MAKAKKEFKNRVRKMQKHIAALIDLTPAGPHMEQLYAIQGGLDELKEGQSRIFEEDPTPLASQRDPRSLAS